MVEAMLLRREADRSLLKGGKVVGHQQVTLSLPPHLENLRDVLASGRSKAIIEALSAPSLADDADAQLMLARFLGFADRLDEAIAIYDRWVESPQRLPALIGKAGALLDQGRIESALALFDLAVAEKPNDPDACEGRARTLDTLGRTGEAAAEFRRFVNLAVGGANLRVRVAQLWLDRLAGAKRSDRISAPIMCSRCRCTLPVPGARVGAVPRIVPARARGAIDVDAFR